MTPINTINPNPPALARQLLDDLASDYPSATCLAVPRRKHGDGSEANAIAEFMYPEKTRLAAIIKYEADIVALRKTVFAQQHAGEEAKRQAKGFTHRENICRQGPWSPTNEFFSGISEGFEDADGFRGGKQGVTAIPMPVEVAKIEDLKPFFDFLKSNRSASSSDISSKVSSTIVKKSLEPYYGVDMVEFNKGVLYTDARMDLCKMVVGPNHIKELMQSLETNDHVKHFLLGNNIIGPTGARAIADFIRKFPNKIETWYLAGNMISASGFSLIADALVGSNIQGLWLKRNPLTKTSCDDLANVILSCPNLHILDLDQTELTDDGVTDLFHLITDKKNQLETIFLNGNGISYKACLAIARFLRSPCTKLKNLYLSGNPIGNKGADVLATGILWNFTLIRFSITSSGINSAGAIRLATAFAEHTKIESIDLGQHIATLDLGFKYNCVGDDAIDAIGRLIFGTKTLRYLNFGTSAITAQGLKRIQSFAKVSSTLWYFQAKSCFARQPASGSLQDRLRFNVKRDLNIPMQEFINGPLRFLRSPHAVRQIDSIYRNRDAQLARRDLMELKKDWNSDDSTMNDVLQYEDKVDVVR